MKTGIAIAGITTLLMLPMGHWQAVNVVENQPSKIAAFEGHWDDGPIPLGIIGWIDEANGRTVALEIPGGVNMLAGDFSRTSRLPGAEQLRSGGPTAAPAHVSDVPLDGSAVGRDAGAHRLAVAGRS